MPAAQADHLDIVRFVFGLLVSSLVDRDFRRFFIASATDKLQLRFTELFGECGKLGRCQGGTAQAQEVVIHIGLFDGGEVSRHSVVLSDPDRKFPRRVRCSTV